MKDIENYLKYSPETGILIWIKNDQVRYIGCQAGNIKRDKNKKPYYIIQFKGKRYPAHRVIYYLMTGEIPNGRIEHLDGNPLNNIWKNIILRNPDDESTKMGSCKKIVKEYVKRDICIQKMVEKLSMTREDARVYYNIIQENIYKSSITKKPLVNDKNLKLMFVKEYEVDHYQNEAKYTIEKIKNLENKNSMFIQLFLAMESQNVRYQ